MVSGPWYVSILLYIVLFQFSKTFSSQRFLLWNAFGKDNPLPIKKVNERSRECHNHKPQPFPDPKRKRKPANPNKQKSNKRTKSTKISSFFPKRGNRNTKRTEKHKNKMTEKHKNKIAILGWNCGSIWWENQKWYSCVYFLLTVLLTVEVLIFTTSRY